MNLSNEQENVGRIAPGDAATSRRRALLVIGSAVPACLMGCLAQSVDTPVDPVTDPQDPDGLGEGGAPSDNPSGDPSGDPSADVDSGATASDAGATHSDTGAAADTRGSTATDTGGGSSPPPSCSPVGTDRGAVSSFPVNSWTLLYSARLIIGHDSGGIYAMTARCTHSGVTLNAPASDGTSYCSAHGAKFDKNGNAIKGPAYSPLAHYAVTVCAGRVYVNTSQKVAASTRAPIS